MYLYLFTFNTPQQTQEIALYRELVGNDYNDRSFDNEKSPFKHTVSWWEMIIMMDCSTMKRVRLNIEKSMLD